MTFIQELFPDSTAETTVSTEQHDGVPITAMSAQTSQQTPTYGLGVARLPIGGLIGHGVEGNNQNEVS